MKPVINLYESTSCKANSHRTASAIADVARPKEGTLDTISLETEGTNLSEIFLKIHSNF